MAALQHVFFEGGNNIAIDMKAADNVGEDDLFLAEIRMHMPAVGGANTLYVKVDSDKGEHFDSILASQDMTAVADKVWKSSDLGNRIRAVDHVTITWVNASAIAWGIEVIFRPVTELD